MAPSQMEDGQHEVQDPLEEINLGELENPKVVYVSKLLEEQLKQDLISMLKEYKDCFAWSYDDMPELDRKLVEHRLPLKEGKTMEFSQLLNLKDSREFKWEESHQRAFDVIKRYLSNPPVLMPPRFLTPVEVKYSVIEKLCLTLYYACTKLRHYLIQSRVFVVAKTDLIKYMLNRPILSGRIGKWSLALAEFTSTYYSQKLIKGQAIVDFLADHPSLDGFIGEQAEFPVCGVGVQPWELKFDGSSTETAAGAGIVITSPRGVKTALSFNLGFPCTNNQAEYEALVIGLEILKDLGAKELLISGDSQLVLKQLSGEFKCTSLSLAPYYTAESQLLDDFEEVSLVHVPRQENWEADELAQVASGLKMSPELTHRLVLIQKKNHPSIQQRGIQVDMLNLDVNLAGDWRDDMKMVLESTGRDIPHGLKMRALNYVLVEGDLYRKGLDGLLLRCFPESLEVMKGCQPCQRHGNIQRIPADELYSVVKPWPFKGWAMDLIGKIYPSSSKGHSFILVATDFFTKWVEAVYLKKVEQGDVFNFVKENLIHRFGIPKSLTTDQGTMFTCSYMREFARRLWN
ncbi:uncharacterized protein LOC142550256 [Primulina tabacum]|uniref:uncharacterized protein LOC142550256 n=1 Tax=Primulina tabacum TaxID=48773 RepID=UPI003F59EA2F